jgi:hypothetical protein
VKIEFEGCWFGVSIYVFIVCGEVLESQIAHNYYDSLVTFAIALV